MGSCVTKFYMDYIVFTRIWFPYVRAIMVIRRVSLV
jgi:hypothetical protein